jgi:hypothetical protein
MHNTHHFTGAHPSSFVETIEIPQSVVHILQLPRTPGYVAIINQRFPRPRAPGALPQKTLMKSCLLQLQNPCSAFLDVPA